MAAAEDHCGLVELAFQISLMRRMSDRRAGSNRSRLLTEFGRRTLYDSIAQIRLWPRGASPDANLHCPPRSLAARDFQRRRRPIRFSGRAIEHDLARRKRVARRIEGAWPRTAVLLKPRFGWDVPSPANPMSFCRWCRSHLVQNQAPGFGGDRTSTPTCPTSVLVVQDEDPERRAGDTLP
jgi:hypothetical protein